MTYTPGGGGAPGPAGPAGAAGAAAFLLDEAIDGDAGVPGPAGAAGVAGAPGAAGAPGTAGPAIFLLDEAFDGDPGSPGPAGVAGAAGGAGSTGAPGPTGPAVFLLDEAIDGEPGPPGLRGETGEKGADGAPGGGGGTATTVEKDLGATPVTQGAFTITDAAITATSKIFIWQAPGPYTGKGTRADEAEMDEILKLTAVPATGSATVRWSSKIGITPFLRDLGGNNLRSSTSPTAPPQENPFAILGARVLGKVKGNVKFAYMVL